MSVKWIWAAPAAITLGMLLRACLRWSDGGMVGAIGASLALADALIVTAAAWSIAGAIYLLRRK
ncbi:hypothetical protein [Rhodocyclus tenuis]|uniref:Uncharacterized protein n=1 Tax=Rhodocyclus tenuis TaxID=1066 RepID=A0A840GCJ6_RHOTE|nr:hypothetical protein [Rhodocyclus tenuis]MBB4248368.1 hypothetical protein [Rhodocyclus tenuis]